MPRQIKIHEHQAKQPDAFIEYSNKALIYVQTHSSKIAAVVGGIALIIAAGFGVKKYQEMQGEEAAEALASLNKDWGKLHPSANTPGKPEVAPPAPSKDIELGFAKRFSQLSDEYSSTSAGQLALVEAGHIYVKHGQYAEAETAYRALLKDVKAENSLYNPTLHALGLCLEQQGKTDEARGMFELLTKASSDLLKDSAFAHLANIADEQKKPEEAKAYRDKLKSTFPASPLIGQ